MNCIKCDKPLPDFEDGVNQPQGGTQFDTCGHYGSTVTDLMDGTRHVINVCDPCLAAAIERGACLLRNASDACPIAAASGVNSNPDVSAIGKAEGGE